MYIIDGPVIGSSASQKLELIAVDLLRLPVPLTSSPWTFNADIPELPDRGYSFRRFILVQRRDQRITMTTLDGLLSKLILPIDNVEAPFCPYQLVRFANFCSPGFRDFAILLQKFGWR